MKYPIDFVYDVKEQFPTDSILYKKLEDGVDIGKFLDDRIRYLNAILLADISNDKRRNVAQGISMITGVNRLHERYQEIAARQKDYNAPQTHFRSIPVR